MSNNSLITKLRIKLGKSRSLTREKKKSGTSTVPWGLLGYIAQKEHNNYIPKLYINVKNTFPLSQKYLSGNIWIEISSTSGIQNGNRKREPLEFLYEKQAFQFT